MVRFLLLLLLLLGGCQGSDNDLEHFRAAEQAFASGRFILAEQLYEQFLQQQPENPSRWQAWKRLLLISENIRQNPRRSLEILQSMSVEYEQDLPRLLEVLQRTASVHRHGLAQPEKSIDVWTRSLDFCPEVPGACWQAHWNMAAVHFDQGRFAESRRELEQCLEWAESQDKKAEAMYMMARSYALNEEHAQALSWIDRLGALEGSSGQHRAQALYMAADIHIQEGRTEQAKKLLTSILETHPNPQLVQLRLHQIESQSQPDP
ncbi:MAG: tetratricopeptide repeat protein [Desulfohalobiaceae bacterium]